MQRFSSDDLRKLASASKAVIGAVAREVVDRRRERTNRAPEPVPVDSRPRRRFKRRWVVVPVLTVVLLVLLLIVGAGFALAWWLGLI